jgi:hypothetical protein
MMSALVRKLLVSTILLILAFAIPAAARGLTDTETSSLSAVVESFDAAMRRNDYETVLLTVPPKIMQHIAKSAGTDVDALRLSAVKQMKAALANVKLLSFDLDLSKAENHELPNGEPYVLIPTETVMDTGEKGKFVAHSQTLAMLDDGKWYLLRVDESTQVEIMRQVYPDFADVDFPTGSTEAAE